jgi:hypothetical protein
MSIKRQKSLISTCKLKMVKITKSIFFLILDSNIFQTFVRSKGSRKCGGFRSHHRHGKSQSRVFRELFAAKNSSRNIEPNLTDQLINSIFKFTG